jgi:predicted aspartyl protease
MVVKVRRLWRFRTIDGRLLERRIDDAIVECLEEQAPTVIVFAEKGNGKVLEVHALEGLRLEVDPSTGGLRTSEAFIAI